MHTEVNRIYGSKPPGLSMAAKEGFSTLRGWVQTLPYADQRQHGIDTVRNAMRSLETHDSALETERARAGRVLTG